MGLATLLTACGGRILGAPTSGDPNATVSDASAPAIVDSSAVLDASVAADVSTALTDAGAAALDATPPLDTSPCLIGGNVLYAGQVVAGVTSGMTLQPPTSEFSIQYLSAGELRLYVSNSSTNDLVDVTGAVRLNDAGWTYAPLQVGTYTDVADVIVNPPAPGYPGLSLWINTLGCGVTEGTFVITSLDIDPTGTLLRGFTLAFEAQCTPPLEQDFGCVHMENLDLILGQ